jgi:hypothetical protein
MFFVDAETTGAGIDSGPGGFPFASSAAVPTPETDGSAEATSADASSPEISDDGQDLSADDVVAARFAASLEADGIEVADPGADDEEEAEPVDPDAIDFSTLTEDQLRQLAEEHLKLKREQAQSSEAQRQAAIAERVKAAEADAVAAVTQQFESTVLSQSAQHYRAQLNQRLAGIVRASRNQDNPDQFIIEQAALAADTVAKAQRTWEAEQAADWDQRAVDAALEARKHVPELRQYFAEELARELGLPPAAAADIAAPQRHIEHFRQRAEELVGLAKVATSERSKAKDQQRKTANQQLREQPIRTSPSGRAPGGKVPTYKGTAEEGSRILALFHK